MTDLAKLPLNALKAFEQVARHLSFTKAAEALNVTTAAVSSQIKLLEDLLETPLFTRTHRQVRLTPQGARLLPGVRRGFDELTQAVEQLRQHRSSGLLNVSLPGPFLQRWLLPRLHDFYQKHPDVDLRFAASHDEIDFATTDFHAAVRYGRGEWPALQQHKLLDEWVFPVASPMLIERLGRINTLADLNRYPLLENSSESWRDWLRAIGGDTTRNDRAPPPQDAAASLAAAERGDGLALARWSLVAGDLNAGRLARPSDQSVHQRSAYYFVAPASTFDLPKVAHFRRWLIECCAQFQPPTGERLESPSID